MYYVWCFSDLFSLTSHVTILCTLDRVPNVCIVTDMKVPRCCGCICVALGMVTSTYMMTSMVPSMCVVLVSNTETSS